MERDTDSVLDTSAEGPNGGLTRRELLRAGTAAALSLGIPVGMAASQPGVPQNLRTSRPVLTPSDIKFVGFYKFPRDAGDLWYSYANLSMRKVANETRLFSIGNTPEDRTYPYNGNNPIFEVAVPPEPPTADINAAPFLPFRRMWGSIMEGRMLTGGSGTVPGGLCWDDGLNGLWWTYGDSYVPVQSHPTLGFTQLNDTAGTYQSFGPWRTQWTSQRTRGALTQLPGAFASGFAGGKRLGVMAGQSSGNVGSPFGCNLSAIGLPNPLSTPPDTTTSTHWTVSNQGLILHDLQHRQSRDTRYKVCGWNTPTQAKSYDCRVNNYITAGVPLWGGADPGTGENDTILGGVWIDLPDKHGMFFFGQLVTTPAGYTAPGDPDGMVHMWYGDPDHATNTGSSAGGYKNGFCCHGQDDPFWGATGPGAHFRVPMGWIYNPDDFIGTAKGQISLWDLVPKSTFEWRQPATEQRFPSAMLGGGVFDPQTRRLYVVLKRADATTNSLYPRPAVMVFDIV